jgi:hypothetical protein
VNHEVQNNLHQTTKGLGSKGVRLLCYHWFGSDSKMIIFRPESSLRTLFGEYREAQAAAQMAEMRWRELQYAQSVSLKKPTVQNMLDELDARLKYQKERQRAAEKAGHGRLIAHDQKAKWCIVSVPLPTFP